MSPQVALLDRDFYTRDQRAAYAWLREQGAVWFDPSCEMYAITTYDAVVAAETNPKVFSSAQGSRPGTRQPSMIDMDDPEHQQRRSLVNRGFTPRRVADLEPGLRAICDDILDAVCEDGACDLVRDIATPLPLIVIGDLLGVLPEDRDDLLRWSDDMLSSQGATSQDELDRIMRAASEFYGYMDKVVKSRKEAPTDDLFSVLVHAQIEGEPFDDLEMIHEALLLLVGGDETTRHVIAGGAEALMQRPDQRDWLVAHPEGIARAVEEMLRWVSPVKNMQRVVTEDTTFFGTDLKAGDKCLLIYEAANFDPAQFTSPDDFDVRREPNHHIAFGVGTHHCLGAALARLELRVMFEQLLGRVPDFRLASDAELPRRRNYFITGIEEMPVTFTPTKRVS